MTSAPTKLLFLLLLLAIGACSSRPTTVQEDGQRYRIIAYVFGDPGSTPISATKLTHINYAFGTIDSTGTVVLRNPRSADHLRRLVALKTQNPRLRVLLSIGGWGADGFSDAALTEDSRRHFAESALAIVRTYALDGADIDWEYPGQPGPGIRFRPEDKQNFTLMLRDLRTVFDAASRQDRRPAGDRYLLTIASAGGGYFRYTEMDRLHPYLDWINIMTYDLFGSYSTETGHHTGLYSLIPGDWKSANGIVNQHIAAGIPTEKLVIGSAWYGKAFTDVQPDSAGNVIGQPFGRYVDEFSYEQLERDFIDKNGYQRMWDPVAKAPYLWNSDSLTVISYEDPESIANKTRYIKVQHLGGIMYWQHRHDPAERLLDAMVRGLRNGS